MHTPGPASHLFAQRQHLIIIDMANLKSLANIEIFEPAVNLLKTGTKLLEIFPVFPTLLKNNGNHSPCKQGICSGSQRDMDISFLGVVDSLGSMITNSLSGLRANSLMTSGAGASDDSPCRSSRSRPACQPGVGPG